MSHHHSHHLAHSLSRVQNRRPSYTIRTKSASNSSDDQHQQQAEIPTRMCKEPLPSRRNASGHIAPSAAGLLGLISGDSGRDFEGLGGWRSSSRYPHHHLSGTTSPSPNGLLVRDANDNDSDGEDEDERAWLSINQRLELPSQPLTLRSNSSTSELVDPSSPAIWRPRRSSQEQPQHPQHGGGRHRHHHRSATTSSLQVSKLSTSSLFLSLSSRPDPGVVAPTHSEPRGGLRGFSPSSSTIKQLPSSVTETLSAATAAADDTRPPLMDGHSSSSAVIDGPPSGSGGAGYFAARPASRASSSGSLTPVEGRWSPRPPGKSMAHYSTGLRYRRRSISGPNSGVQFLQP
ncbi:uncharacterized protein BP01DRAFT_358837 [Aspergillus saccharolyticus JOP 1030-1]|uniref:Uncharacterized protein n=1 Tax=Aspergillus saccharolyticus JOP 1030-1 TaxID=1450539 RepID=A0A318ZF84_9EURO|nr:hypothetical protein BP01DRAFT_358837 [Aspergillus saccharolyticus JOP 1030-1]PYH43303.1 hypothetical protein BP01DRAFT_358837 [Aspergillus saccharolyticus JOP 1030-1]